MTYQFLKSTFKAFALVVFMLTVMCCNSSNTTELKDATPAVSEKESIPDTVVQFLITSASDDFRKHRPPTPVDFRNVKIGYSKSPKGEKTFLLCGEFLSQEDNEWAEFTTIKTSGYEQYLGKTHYCQDANMVLADENLSAELKKKLAEK